MFFLFFLDNFEILEIRTIFNEIYLIFSGILPKTLGRNIYFYAKNIFSLSKT